MPYLITEKKRCLLSKNQRPVTMIFFRFMQLFQEKTGNSFSLSKSFCIFASKKNDWLWTRRSLKTSVSCGKAMGRRRTSGMRMAIAKNLFTPFFSTKPQGQGLGLLLIRDILTSHHCTFNLLTDPEDHLTRFTIQFPHK